LRALALNMLRFVVENGERAGRENCGRADQVPLIRANLLLFRQCHEAPRSNLRASPHILTTVSIVSEETTPAIGFRLGLEESVDDRLPIVSKQSDQTLVR
jgi:hypothetical protein